MTSKEQQSVDRLYELAATMKASNAEFAKQVTDALAVMNTRVEKKHIPVNLEQNILQVTSDSIQKSINECLTRYDSPLMRLTKEVVESHSMELKGIINEAFDAVITTDAFKVRLREAFSHKIARTLIANQEGLLEKVGNELKQDVVFKSKLTMAVSNVVNECLAGSQTQVE